MRALAKLQAESLVQLNAIEPVRNKLLPDVRKYLSVLAVAALATLAGPGVGTAHADTCNQVQNVMTSVGTTLGGMAGISGGKVAYAKAAIGATLGGAAGSIAGNIICGNQQQPNQGNQALAGSGYVSPEQAQAQIRAMQQQQMQQYQMQQHGQYQQVQNQPPQQVVVQPAVQVRSGMPLSGEEARSLDQKLDAVMKSKQVWLRAVGQAEAGKGSADTPLRQYVQARDGYIDLVVALQNGEDSMGKRDVSRYADTVQALQSIPTNKALTHDQLLVAEQTARLQHRDYAQQMDKVTPGFKPPQMF